MFNKGEIMFRTMMSMVLLMGIASSVASADVRLGRRAYMALSAPDDFILQGGYSAYGDARSVRESVQIRADQYCAYFDRNSQAVDYRISRVRQTGSLNMIGYGWEVERVPSNLVAPFTDQGITGYARAFSYIDCD